MKKTVPHDGLPHTPRTDHNCKERGLARLPASRPGRRPAREQARAPTTTRACQGRAPPTNCPGQGAAHKSTRPGRLPAPPNGAHRRSRRGRRPQIYQARASSSSAGRSASPTIVADCAASQSSRRRCSSPPQANKKGPQSSRRRCPFGGCCSLFHRRPAFSDGESRTPSTPTPSMTGNRGRLAHR
jgi:hypothetical protein